MHDPTKVALGATGSSDKVVTCEAANPASFPAAVAVRRTSSGGLVIADDSTAQLIGVSLGKSLSDHTKTAVCRSGNFVPLKLKDEGVQASLVVGDLTFTAVEKGTDGNSLTVALIDALNDGTAAVASFNGTNLVVNIEATVTTAQAIADAVNNHEAASEFFTVTVAEGQGAVAQAAAAQAPLENGAESFPYVAKGGAVLIDATTGEASSDGDPTGAVYLSSTLTGVYMDGTTTMVALVDMPGGL